MRKIIVILLIAIAIMVAVCACSQEKPDSQDKINSRNKSGNFVLIKGGTIKSTKSKYNKSHLKIPDFYICKYEVTQREWFDVMGDNPSEFKGKNWKVEVAGNPLEFKGYNLPVETVSWYDCVEYCNKRSISEGLKPYYNINRDKKDVDNKNANDNIKWIVTINKEANGYRLPTEAEWDYAAGGGRESKSYTYSGSNEANEVAWYWVNSGDQILTGGWSFSIIKSNNNKTKPIGTKKPNELGLYDMSGNVREWCWDWYEDTEGNSKAERVMRGGGWLGDGISCQLSYRDKWDANSKSSDTGFRVCRGA